MTKKAWMHRMNRIDAVVERVATASRVESASIEPLGLELFSPDPAHPVYPCSKLGPMLPDAEQHMDAQDEQDKEKEMIERGRGGESYRVAD